MAPSAPINTAHAGTKTAVHKVLSAHHAAVIGQTANATAHTAVIRAVRAPARMVIVAVTFGFVSINFVSHSKSGVIAS